MSGFIANIFFGVIGFAAFVYGKKTARYKVLGIGAVLIVFPYFIESALWLWVIGAGLTVSLFVFRD